MLVRHALEKFMPLRPGFDIERFNIFGKDYLPGLVGVIFKEVSEGLVKGEVPLRKALLAPNGYLHAGTIVTFADTLCGYGCIAHLPGNAENFTTVELKSNFLGTAREGTVHGEARAVHLGRTTQVWDAVVTHGDERRRLALFRCTQLLIYPRQPS
jgi:1,4-dihydroxy-2-naphthoyl-CoA hydrolase